MTLPYLVFILGTRAQLVKIAPVINAAHEAGLRHEIVLTGQHKDSMVELAHDLGVGTSFPSADLARERASILSLLGWAPSALINCVKRVRGINSREANCCVVVHGDTLSTLVGAAAARLMSINVAHIESGLCSGALFNPFPEEVIRRLVFKLTDFAYCPEESSAQRMSANAKCIAVNTNGNTIIDSVRRVMESDRVECPPSAERVIVSIHRFENIMPKARLSALVDMVLAVASEYRTTMVLHPPTEQRLRKFGLLCKLQEAEGVELLPRMAYSRFVNMVATARVVLTDGGSNQEELGLLGVPTIILRQRSERSDGLGENAVFEADLTSGVVAFVCSDQCLSLRRRSNLSSSGFPSRTIVESLRVLGRVNA